MSKLLVILLSSTLLFAQDIMLQDINIQASEINTPSSQVSEERALETRSITLSQKLEQDISFTKTSIGKGNEGISFRGLDFKATEYVEDGIPLYRSTGGLIDTNFNMTNSNIHINDGSGVSSTGVSAMGGEVEISSQVPTKELEIKLGSTVSTNDEFYYTSVGAEMDNVYVVADASYYHRSDYELSDDYKATQTQGKGKRINSDKEQRNVSLKAGVFLSDSLHVAAKISHSKAEYGLEPNIYTTPINKKWNSYTRIDPKELNSYYLYLDYDYDEFEFSLRAYYDDYEDKYTVYDDINYNNNYDIVTYDDSRLGTILKATRTKGSSKTSFIFLSERNEHIRLGGGLPKATTKLDTYKPSLLHVEQISDDFELETAVSYTLMTQKEAADASATNPAKDKKALDALAKLSHKDEKSLLYAGIARKSRMPTMNEMFTFFTFSTPNPNLDPERSWQYSAGYKYMLNEKSSMNFEIYYYDIKDLIVETNAGFINKDSAEHYGAEFRLNTKQFTRNEISFAYAYAHAQDDENNELAHIPKHKIILQDSIKITQNVNAFISYEYFSSQYSYNYPIDLDNLEKIDDYSLVNAQVSYAIKDKLSTRLGVKNIMDENYEWQYGFPAQGRSFYISLEWNL